MLPETAPHRIPTQRAPAPLFDPNRTESTATGWKLGVSKQSNLKEAKSTLLKIVGPASDHTEIIRAHWALNSALSEADIVLYAVDKDDVMSGSTVHLKSFCDRISMNDTLLLKLQGRIEISISGYDDDPRELWEIPEVIAWFKKADDAFHD
jgi:hypothetical protein